MIRKVTSHLDNVEVMSFSGLLVDFAKQQEPVYQSEDYAQ